MIGHQTQNQKESLPQNATNESWHAALLGWFSPNKEQAEHRYQNLRQKLVVLFARQGVRSPFIEEMADETLERAGHKLASGEVVRHSEPMAYLHGIAKNVLFEHWREQQKLAAKEIPLDDFFSLSANKLEFSLQQPNDPDERERLLECLNKFLSRLSPEDEDLLRSCYHDNKRQQAANRRAAAKRLNLAESSLRANLYRICQSLKPKVRACVERLQK